MNGRRVGRYQILAPLGRGGMASVWRARDELRGGEVALKLLAESLSTHADARHRFRHEAQLAARLDHPGIVAIHDSGEADGETYIAMSLIDGETVVERLERSLPPISEVLRIASVAAGALGYAHARGVVHRDVTSRNIMLARDGRVLVLDFGVALAQGVSRVTGPDTTVGTLAYMAPEVLKGSEASTCSDLYGLGVVLYEALTGQLPFKADNGEAVRYLALNKQVSPPSHYRSEIGEPLDQLVLKLLARNPEQRYPGADVLLADLHVLSDAAPEPARRRALSSSASAEVLASGRGPVYLAILPFDTHVITREGIGDAARLARELRETMAAAIAELQRVHIVTDAGVPAPGEEPLAFARRAGAQLLLGGTLRLVGAHARITWRLTDPEHGVQIAGGTLRGAACDVFDLEDQLVAGVRGALGIPVDPALVRTRPVTRDPAEAERLQQAMSYLRRTYDESAMDGAIAILDRLAQSSPDNAVVWATLARANLFKFRLSGQHVWEGRATTAVERARRIAPEDPDVLLALGETHLAAGRSDLALREFEKALTKRSDWFEGRLGLAEAFKAAGHFEEAEEACRVAIDLAPEDWRGHQLLGTVQLRRGEFASAVGTWRRVMQLCPDNSRAASHLGGALFHLDRHEEAIDAYRLALRIQPNPNAFTNLGTVLFYLERYEEACDAFEKAVALGPSNPVMWGNLGNAARFVPARNARAREALDRAIGLMQERLSRNPENYDGWSRLAGWFANLDRADDARLAIDRAFAAAPDDVHVMVRAGNVFCQLGEHDDAIRWLERAVRAGYGVDAFVHAPDLAPLRSNPRFVRLLTAGRDSHPSSPSD